MTNVYSTACTSWFIAAQQAVPAGGAPVNLLGGTLKVGDGNGVVPTISQIIANGGVLHQVWAGAPNSVTIDATNTGQIDVGCLIPTVDGSGNEIGPFNVTEFAIYDATGNLAIVGTTNLQKTTSAQGQLMTLQWNACYIAAAASAVTLQPPAGSYPTLGAIQTALAGLLSVLSPLSLVKTVLSSGWTSWQIAINKAFQPADATGAQDAAAMGVGRPATNAEFAAGAPETGGYAWPWPTLQQVTTAFLRPPPQTTFYVNFAAGSDATGDGLTTGAAWATINHAIATISAKYTYPGQITIQCANGALIGAVNQVLASFGPSQVSSWLLLGNTATPSSCALNASASGGRCVYSGQNAVVTVSGFAFSSYYENASASDKGSITVENCIISPPGNSNAAALGCYASSYLQLGPNITLSAGAYEYFCEAGQGACVQFGYYDLAQQVGCNLTLNGTPSFAGAFVVATQGGNIVVYPSVVSFAGAATGSRYYASGNGVVSTQGSGASYFPGSAAGSTSTGGQYL